MTLKLKESTMNKLKLTEVENAPSISKYKSAIENNILPALNDFGIKVRPIHLMNPYKLTYKGTLDDGMFEITFNTSSNLIDDENYPVFVTVSYNQRAVYSGAINPKNADESFDAISHALENELGYETKEDKELRLAQQKKKEQQKQLDKQEWAEKVKRMKEINGEANDEEPEEEVEDFQQSFSTLLDKFCSEAKTNDLLTLSIEGSTDKATATRVYNIYKATSKQLLLQEKCTSSNIFDNEFDGMITPTDLKERINNFIEKYDGKPNMVTWTNTNKETVYSDFFGEY